MEKGNWQQAKALLEQLKEPFVTGEEQDVSINLPDILGYQVNYYRHKTQNGIKSFTVIINHDLSSCYIRNFY